MKKKFIQKPRLSFKQETIRMLTRAQLGLAAGGYTVPSEDIACSKAESACPGC